MSNENKKLKEPISGFDKTYNKGSTYAYNKMKDPFKKIL